MWNVRSNWKTEIWAQELELGEVKLPPGLRISSYLSFSWPFQEESSRSRAPSKFKRLDFLSISLRGSDEAIIEPCDLRLDMVSLPVWAGLKYCSLISVLWRTLSLADHTIHSAELRPVTASNSGVCFKSKPAITQTGTQVRNLLSPQTLPPHPPTPQTPAVKVPLCNAPSS